MTIEYWRIVTVVTVVLLLAAHSTATPTEEAAQKAGERQAAGLQATLTYANKEGARVPRQPASIGSMEALRQLLEQADAEQLPVVVMFFAPWCNHCRSMMPSVVQAAAELDAKSSRRYVLALVDGAGHPELMLPAWRLRGFPSFLLVSQYDVEQIYPHSLADWHRLNERLARPALLASDDRDGADNAPAMSGWRLRQLLNSHAVTFVLLGDASCPDDQLARRNFLAASQRYRHRADFVLWQRPSAADRHDLLFASTLAAAVPADSRARWQRGACPPPLVLAFKDPTPDAASGALHVSAVFEGPYAAQTRDLSVWADGGEQDRRLPLLRWIDAHRYQYVHKLSADEWHLLGTRAPCAVIAVLDSAATDAFHFIQAVKQVERSAALGDAAAFFWLDADARPTFVASMGCSRLPCLIVWEVPEARFWRFEQPPPDPAVLAAHVADALAGRLPAHSTLKGFWQHVDFYWSKMLQLIRTYIWYVAGALALLFVYLIHSAVKIITAPVEQLADDGEPTTTATQQQEEEQNDQEKKNQ